MNINLHKLSLRNFKGIKDLSMIFGHESNIYGENASGKTTIFDAFNWLLFDKDSSDRSTFNIKTLDKDGNIIHGIEHEVEGTMEINGSPITLKKIYKEKWVKRKGETEKLLTGHETLYWIDEVPARKKDYVEKIQSLISEDVFKLITNPLHFNVNMKWIDRRDLLDQIAGSVDDAEVMANNKQLEPLVKALKGKTVDDFKKVTLAQKRKLNNEIKAIPIRIDELHNSLPSLEVDFDSIEKDLAFNESELRVVDACILDSATFYDDLSKKRELLYEKKTQLQKREYLAELERDKPLQELKDQLSTTEDAIRTTDLHRKALTSEEKEVNRLLESATKTIEAKREEWHKVNSETLEFDEHDFVCPTCNREFEDVDIKIKQEEISKRFISNKANIIQEINTVGALYAQDVLGYQERLEQLDVEIKQKQDYLSKLEDNKVIAEKAIKSYVPGSSLETNSEYLKLKEEIEGIEKSIDTTSMDSTVSKLQEEKAKITGAIDSIKYELSKKEQSEKIQKRINVLKDEEKTLAQQITQLEGQEYLCDEFVRKKVSFLESRINSYFKKVTFKLFNTLVNGSIEECCETLIDGVPFQDANNAGKINAGIDIINTLSKHFKVSAPIFIDNREGVIELQETDAQIVNLRVSEVSKYSKDALSDKKELIGTNNKKLYMEVI